MTATLVIERQLPHAPEKVIGDWLMQAADFEPTVGRRFNLRTDPQPYWNGVLDCEVLEAEPPHRLAYSWNTSGEEDGRLNTTVTFTLTAKDGGCLVRMEQAGFPDATGPNYTGASYGWRKNLERLEEVIASL